MITVHELKASMFHALLEGHEVSGPELLDWGLHDRLGIVVNDPLGAMGAALLAILAAVAFYDSDRRRRLLTLFPPLYLFHVGRDWGFHGPLDCWPDRKEIIATEDPVELLGLINEAGITHLAVPAGNTQIPVAHRYREVDEARDRLKQCYAYSPSGVVRNANIQIKTHSRLVIEQLLRVAFPAWALKQTERYVAARPKFRANTPLGKDIRHYVETMRARIPKLSQSSGPMLELRVRMNEALAAHQLTQTVRRIEAREAIHRLF
jgi:hypothetical protein